MVKVSHGEHRGSQYDKCICFHETLFTTSMPDTTDLPPRDLGSVHLMLNDKRISAARTRHYQQLRHLQQTPSGS
jgi:hypothetical protein